MKIEKIDIKKLIPYENNAKLHDKTHIEQIKASIEKFGNNDPIACDENNVIIEGHGRLIALKELGYKECDVIKLTHLTDEQKKAYILAHNKLTMNTGFDITLLQLELDSITNIDMANFGFIDFDYIDDLTNSDMVNPVEPSEFEVSFYIDKKYQDDVLEYIKENGKDVLIELMLNHIKEGYNG